MALMNESFVTEEVEDVSFDPVPANIYTVQIVASEFKATKDGTGEYLSLRFEILDDEFNGRNVFTNLNLVNKNDQAVKIARSQLKEICLACGIAELQDTQELHGIPMQATVTYVPAQMAVNEETGEEYIKYEASNGIKKFKGEGGGDATAGADDSSDPFES